MDAPGRFIGYSKKIIMIQYGKQNINEADIKAVVKTLRSDWLTQGPKVKEFEEKLAAYCGVKYAVACSNGTAALHLAYMAAGLSKGDEVITTPNTFVATTNMMLVVGAKPVFCDIRLDTYNIDEKQIEKHITKKTKAIVPVHFAGHPCEMSVIRRIAKKHKLLIIEDACHALGASYKNSKIGSCKFSDMAVMSFHPVKPITTGEGGAILTNNKEYYQKLLSLRSHGVHKDKNGKNVMTELGYNYRMTDIQAALGISQLKRLDSFVKKRHRVIKWYTQGFKDVDGIILPVELKNNYSSWHIYVIRVRDIKIRDRLIKYLAAKGVGVNFHYPAVYKHPYYLKAGFKDVGLLNMEKYQKSSITIPCHVLLERIDINFITSLLINF